MRCLLLPLTLCLCLAATTACSGDDETLPPDATVRIDGPVTPTPDAPPPAIDAAPAVDSAVATADAPPTGPDATPNDPPMINSVTWSHGAGCVVGASHAVTVATDATDDLPGLVYSGSVAGCSGAINSATAMITCPELAPYTGTVTVTDSGGLTDSQMITISPCANGMAP